MDKMTTCGLTDLHLLDRIGDQLAVVDPDCQRDKDKIEQVESTPIPNRSSIIPMTSRKLQ
jgi:hypothetical protein